MHDGVRAIRETYGTNIQALALDVPIPEWFNRSAWEHSQKLNDDETEDDITQSDKTSDAKPVVMEDLQVESYQRYLYKTERDDVKVPADID